MLARFVFLVAIAMSGSCLAQVTVGELSKQGATKLSKEDLQQLFAGGVTQKGVLANGTPYTQQNKADGTITGSAGPSGQFALNGTWKLEDSGKICMDIRGSGNFTINNCGFVWKVGEKYFGGPEDTPNSVTRERQYSK